MRAPPHTHTPLSPNGNAVCLWRRTDTIIEPRARLLDTALELLDASLAVQVAALLDRAAALCHLHVAVAAAALAG